MVDIIYKLNKVEDVERVRDCILSLVGKGQIKPSEVFVNEFVTRCNFHIAVMKQSTAMAGRTDQPPAEPTTGTDTDQQHPEPPAPSIEEETATCSEKEPATAFEIPKFLQSERAEKILKGLESISGANDTQVLDRSKTPWGYSSYKDWGQVAESVTEKLSVRMLWQQWAKLIGVRANTLKTEYHSSKISTETQQRIKDYIKTF